MLTTPELETSSKRSDFILKKFQEYNPQRGYQAWKHHWSYYHRQPIQRRLGGFGDFSCLMQADDNWPAAKYERAATSNKEEDSDPRLFAKLKSNEIDVKNSLPSDPLKGRQTEAHGAGGDAQMLSHSTRACCILLAMGMAILNFLAIWILGMDVRPVDRDMYNHTQFA
jgi:hypothetical protein